MSYQSKFLQINWSKSIALANSPDIALALAFSVEYDRVWLDIELDLDAIKN